MATPRPAPFPEGAGAPAGEPLRVAIDRAPMADLLAHAAATTDVEVGGVLVGTSGRDDAGPFIHVSAVIRAEQAREASAHITFTHDTWSHIHGEMDRRHKGREIVGWYHTHPGFGVFLSEMDTFIHKNFFSAPHQAALVYDPLSGHTAMYVLEGDALRRIERFWRDGREVRLQGRSESEGTARSDAPSALERELLQLREAVSRLELRVASPRPQGWLEGWITPFLLLVLVGLLIGQGYGLFGDARVQRLKAESFDQILTLIDAGMIRIIDARTGQPMPLAGTRPPGTGPRPPGAAPGPAPAPRSEAPAPPRDGAP